jgi:hypothetical protein
LRTQEQQQDDLEAAVELAISACDGDARAAVRALLVANDFLHREVDRLHALCSRGFARGKLTLMDLP